MGSKRSVYSLTKHHDRRQRRVEEKSRGVLSPDTTLPKPILEEEEVDQSQQENVEPNYDQL